MMNVYLSTDPPVHFFTTPVAAGFACYTAAVFSADRSYANVYWLEEVVGPVDQRFGERASASRTFSGITDVIAEVQSEVDRFWCRYWCPCILNLFFPAC